MLIERHKSFAEFQHARRRLDLWHLGIVMLFGLESRLEQSKVVKFLHGAIEINYFLDSLIFIGNKLTI